MSTSYAITPYEPYPSSRAELKQRQRSVELRIDPALYRQSLLERWPLAREFENYVGFPVSYHLNWRSSDGIRWAGIEVILHKDLQTVSFHPPTIEFIFWHRTLIPSQFKLYLSNDSSVDYTEIPVGVPIEEMAHQLDFEPPGEPQVIFYIANENEVSEHRNLRVEGSDAWRVFRSAQLEAHGFIQCAGAQQIRRLANVRHHGQHGLSLMWLFVDHITAPIKYMELPGISAPGETFPRITGPLDGMAIGRIMPYEPGPDGTFPWPVDIEHVS